ncbi:MAG: hypothetical protein U1D30_23040 [Planctomycetota bacterium]
MNSTTPQPSKGTDPEGDVAAISNGPRESLVDWLERFRCEMGGRTAGVWKLQGIHLVNLGHSFAPDVDEVVSSAFRLQTAVVRLSRWDLAIVAAVIAKDTVSATVTGPLEGSGQWLERLGAERSFATAILGERTILGVLGISFTDDVRDDHKMREQLERWAGEGIRHITSPA